MLRRLLSPGILRRCSLPVHGPGGIAVHTNLIDSRLQTPVGAVVADNGRARHRSNRSRRGLYDGKDVRFGNQVSFSNRKTRRKWKPNVQMKRLYSEVLDEMLRFHVTTSALRTIDKYGGLDNYLLNSRHVSTEGFGEGQRARNRIVMTLKQREKLREEAIERGESVDDWDKIPLVGKKVKSNEEVGEGEDDAAA
mmetsp:Transcript_22876/g.53942  ORF Transcript_22876/g.53942 Transcript_22876/m.53942 type:complete len:194 (-) Transcript_22876:94-675(-)